MRTLILFLLVTFILGGTRQGQRFLRRPSLLMAMCLVVGAAYYSYRVVR